MPVEIIHSTPFPEVNAVLQELLEGVSRLLGHTFIGMYLEGSLANGDFDEDSDIDFVVVTSEAVSDDSFVALQAMHERIAALDSWCAIQLEGSYISKHALRRHDPDHAHHPNLERGSGERLKLASHDKNWIIHRFILRERGITLTGPDPKTLIDPVSPDELRRVMFPTLNGWAARFLTNPDLIIARGYQSYVVLSLCRILYTLEFGDVVSKRAAANWAQNNLDGSWKALIDRTWVSRHNPTLTASSEDISQTLDFIRYAQAYSQQAKFSALS